MALRAFLADERGGSAAEFALILPIYLLFLVGLIDVGRYTWAINEANKATQVGARWAVVTDLIPSDLATYSFAIDGGVGQGLPVENDVFSGIHCESTGGTAECECGDGVDAGICPENLDAAATDQDAFDQLVERMRTIYPRLTADDVVVDYINSGLGFSGDPNGADVAPSIRVSLRNQTFPLFSMLGNEVLLPSFSYALTMEDGAGDFANY